MTYHVAAETALRGSHVLENKVASVSVTFGLLSLVHFREHFVADPECFEASRDTAISAYPHQDFLDLVARHAIGQRGFQMQS
jgi:hypothetical protein